jgi:hypothetical protein
MAANACCGGLAFGIDDGNNHRMVSALAKRGTWRQGNGRQGTSPGNVARERRQKTLARKRSPENGDPKNDYQQTTASRRWPADDD